MYIHPVTGEAVYSVTTIISAGIPKDLADWAAKQSAQAVLDDWAYVSSLMERGKAQDAYDFISSAHKRTRDEAAEKGDRVHNSAEALVQGKDDGLSPKHMKQLKNFLAVSGFKMTYQEVTLWNRSEEYAGTADWIAEDRNGRFVLGDYKTGKYIWPEMAVQLEALAKCEFIVTQTGEELEMPDIYTVGVAHLRPLSWWWHPIQDRYTRDTSFATFLQAKKVHEALAPIHKWKRYHPNMVWGNLGRFNEDNWPQAKAA